MSLARRLDDLKAQQAAVMAGDDDLAKLKLSIDALTVAIEGQQVGIGHIIRVLQQLDQRVTALENARKPAVLNPQGQRAN